MNEMIAALHRWFEGDPPPEVGFEANGVSYTSARPVLSPPGTIEDVQRWIAYAAYLVSQLYPHTKQGDIDTQSERGTDYCDVYDTWKAIVDDGGQTAPGILVRFLITIASAVVAKADKWGIAIDMNPVWGATVTGPTPYPCREGQIPKDSSWTGAAGNWLDNLVKGGGVLLPIIIVVGILSQLADIASVFGGGDDRRRR